VAHTSKWEPIGAALKRVVEQGLRDDEAKRGLCEEISDARIAIRQDLAADPSRGLPKTSFDGLPNGARLSPEDIDWQHSRPSSPLSPVWIHASQRLGEPTSLYIRDKHHLMNRTVELIKVRAADVTQIFCGSEKLADISSPASPVERKPDGGVSPPAGKHESSGDDGPMVLATIEVILELWPDGTRLRAKDSYPRIREGLKAKGHSKVSDSTIQRAFRALKNRHQSL
jgi:hypothetical protein